MCKRLGDQGRGNVGEQKLRCCLEEFMVKPSDKKDEEADSKEATPEIAGGFY